MTTSRHVVIVEVYPRNPEVIYRVDREEGLRQLLTRKNPSRTFEALAGKGTAELEGLITAALDTNTLTPALVGFVNGHLVVVR